MASTNEPGSEDMMIAARHTDGILFAQRAAQADGLFCAACGIVMALGGDGLASWAGLASSLPLFILGIGLIVYGAALIGLARAYPGHVRLTQTILVLNLLWVIGSIPILVFNPFRLTSGALVALLVIGLAVGGFALWQNAALRRLRA
ncbi:MAG: hypothetical protein JNM70_16295 [Anaerolineae bacterium]|nr:hypothetical protein [Anaerolineae bacterium]